MWQSSTNLLFVPSDEADNPAESPVAVSSFLQVPILIQTITTLNHLKSISLGLLDPCSCCYYLPYTQLLLYSPTVAVW